MAGTVVLLAAAARGATVAEVQEFIAAGKNVTVIDVRSPELFARSHIPTAINIPASVCPYKNLPHFEKVVVYGGGILSDDAADAVVALRGRREASVDVLEGGYAAWLSAHALTTAGRGLKPEGFNYISYRDLKAAAAASVLLVDLRRQKDADAPLSDLGAEFPGMRVTKSTPAAGGPLTVLIDSGDGAAEAAARRMKAAGNHRYVILVGGELIIARHGKRGSQRLGSNPRVLAGPRPNP